MPTKNDAGLFEETIDGKVYEFQKWGAEEATDVLEDLTLLAGKSLAVAVACFKSGDAKAELTPDVVGTVMEHLLNSMGTHKGLAKKLIKKFAADKALCDGVKIAFDRHYADDLAHMLRVVRANLEVQFGNFFAGLLAQGGQPGPLARPVNIHNRT